MQYRTKALYTKLQRPKQESLLAHKECNPSRCRPMLTAADISASKHYLGNALSITHMRIKAHYTTVQLPLKEVGPAISSSTSTGKSSDTKQQVMHF
jgi:hypothetical protein